MDSTTPGRHPVPGIDVQQGPVLPIFVQMNVRLTEGDDRWREVARWVRYQETVEEGGQRWSKPHVPSCSVAVMLSLKMQLERSAIILDSTADSLTAVIDQILGATELNNTSDRQKIKHLFRQGVSQKMKLSLFRQLSGHRGGDCDSPLLLGTEQSPDGDEVDAEDGELKIRRKTDGSLEDEVHKDDIVKRRYFSALVPSRGSSKEETMKLREFNLFQKKVPKNTEAANVQVLTTSLVNDVVFAFVRLETPVLLEDICELNLPTRFLVVFLGPEGSGHQLQELGAAMAAALSDPLFCGETAYEARTRGDLLLGLQAHIDEMTALSPASWDPATRIDPPPASQSLTKRLAKRQQRSRQTRTPKEEESTKPDSLKELIAEEDEELQFTGKLFGGLRNDIKRKLPWFKSDFTDALHVQTIATIIYIYLATITKAITFGGFLGDITGGLQGVLESFLGHALAGGFFCLLAGQPLTVLGCTGPVLIFERILVEFCSSQGLNYLTLRLWIGLWSAAFCLVIVAVDGSAIVRYFTRFTEEAFAALVGIIFVVESFKKLTSLGKEFKVHKGNFHDAACSCLPPVDIREEMEFQSSESQSLLQLLNVSTIEDNAEKTTVLTGDVPWGHLSHSHCIMLGGKLVGEGCGYVPDIYFFSCILFFGSFLLCFALKRFKLTPFFPSWVRSLLADYAVVLSITVFVVVDSYYDLATPKLIVPTEFKPTRSDLRGWFIPFYDDNSAWYVYLLASLPAILLTILLFMDQQITSVIVNRKEHKLKKGCGYHLDMLLVGLMTGLCSVLGLPWCVAATVLCLGHVDSLKMDTESTAPGEPPQFLGVREQRVTGVMVFVLTGLSVKLAPILKYIPMPVLYGVLLYMGVNTLAGMQFIDRIALMLMPSKHQPDYPYLRHVPLRKVHLFTCIQVLSLASLWLIKSTPASLVFPVMVLALVGIRKLMDHFPSLFSQTHLYWLDNLMPQSKKGKKINDLERKGVKQALNSEVTSVIPVSEKESINQEKHFSDCD